MNITFVKKILASGQPCSKCADVEARLRDTGQMDRIDRIVIADENDENSEGMVLARQHEVTRAPFFIVEDDNETRVYTVYFKFAREVLGTDSKKADEAGEILKDNPDLDYL